MAAAGILTPHLKSYMKGEMGVSMYKYLWGVPRFFVFIGRKLLNARHSILTFLYQKEVKTRNFLNDDLMKKKENGDS